MIDLVATYPVAAIHHYNCSIYDAAKAWVQKTPERTKKTTLSAKAYPRIAHDATHYIANTLLFFYLCRYSRPEGIFIKIRRPA